MTQVQIRRGTDHVAAAAGDVIHIIGASGSGKSTLLQALLGDARALELFTVTVDTHSLRRVGGEAHLRHLRRLAAHRRTCAGVVHPAASPPGLTPRQLVELTADRSINVENHLQSLGLADVGSLPLRRCTAGQQALAATAAALASPARIIALDNPAAACDPAATLDILAAARRSADHGALVLHVTHDLALVRACAGRTWQLDRHGRLREIPPAGSA